ncbi:MAG: hypothetical protein R3266_09950 [Gemmatimonadota bacterium]|nr:hypothetical protein [Gemmatimonadota bacterium]
MTLYFGDMLPPPRDDDQSQGEHVLVGTAAPIQLEVHPIEHHLTPEGAVCIGTFHEGRPIGRCAIPGDSVEDFLEMDLFEEPVSLALNVRLGGPGLEGSLLALVPMERGEEDRDEDEPWRASVPGSGYDVEPASDDASEGSNSQLVGIFLGEIVRFEEDRRNEDSLLREAADMLAGVIRGQVGTLVDRVIEDLTTHPEG